MILSLFSLTSRPPPCSTLPDTRLPYTTLCRSADSALRSEGFSALRVNVNAEADRQIAEAKGRAAEGERAAAEAEAEAARLQARLTDAQRQMQAAKTDPTCAEQLRIQLCAAIPLL